MDLETLIFSVGFGLAGAVGALWWLTVEPRFSRRPARITAEIDPARLERHVRTISMELGPRDHEHPESLDGVARYIAIELRSAGLLVEDQRFQINGVPYRNVIASAGPDSKERIVVGAHYDTCGPLPGADDNASGVAGLIELGRVLAKHPPPVRVELVAFCLEEPPYFQTEGMGSAIHAESLRAEGIPVRFMISLEMLGYFSSSPGSQRYPARFLSWFYPTIGDFVGVVGTFGQKGLTGSFREWMKAACAVPVVSITASRLLPGIDYSDHRNYWNRGIPALMVTDTSFYRNASYHTAGDTSDTLDYVKMAEVVRGVANAVMEGAHSA